MALNRSEQMARIRSRNTKPECLLRKLLWREGLRYRLHAKTPVGRPDLVFPGPKVAVFVDGCFWHGCPDHYVRPRSSDEFWAEKLAANVRRDVEQTRKLEELGWHVIRFWEHEVFENPDVAVRRVTAAVRMQRSYVVESWRVYRVNVVDRVADRERRYMYDLRDPSRRRQVTRKRSTKKWGVQK